MGGLSTILESIVREAKYTADKFMEEAFEKKQAIKAKCKEDKAKLEADMAEGLQVDCMSLSERIEAAASSEARQIILSAKQQAIDAVSLYLKDSLKNAEADEYFAFLEKLALKNSEEAEGMMYLSSADLERLPADFEKRINDGLVNGKIIISKEAGNIDGGFIIRYGRIDINCTIDGIFEDKKNRISDIINEKLFGEG